MSGNDTFGWPHKVTGMEPFDCETGTQVNAIIETPQSCGHKGEAPEDSEAKIE
jgi:hypothetical protein